MRCLNRNKKAFWYALYIGEQSMTDEHDYETGETEVLYSHPARLFGNISAARGETGTQEFGDNEAYDRTIVLDDPTTPINENAVLWVDVVPTLNVDGSTNTPWDYIVKRVARSINSVTIAISKVNVA